MYGQLLNPLSVLDTIVGGSQRVDVFKRKAFGGKIGVGTSSNFIDLIIFKAKDQLTSTFDPAERYVPAENAVLGIDFKTTLFRIFEVYANTAASVFTRNQLAEQFPINNTNARKAIDLFSGVITPNISTRLGVAGDGGFNFRFKKFGFGMAYQRIDPTYSSMGAYYFQDDNENFTGKLNFKMAKGKLNFNGSGGLQRNNTKNLRALQTVRKIGSGNINWRPGEGKFTLDARFSNFNFDQKPGLQRINDTLRFVQTNYLAGISPYYSYIKGAVTHSYSFNLDYQIVNDLATDPDLSSDSKLYNGVISYQWRHKNKNLGWSSSGVFSKNSFANKQTSAYGLTLGTDKSFFKKTLSCRLGFNGNLNYIEGTPNGNSFGINLSSNYKISKVQSLNCSVNFFHRNPSIKAAYSEWRGNISYAYTFNPQKKNTKK
jgi:hypothetical protein